MTDTDTSGSVEPLLEVAQRLVVSGQPWSMAQLAREAKVSRATLYRRFGSREAVEEALREAGLEANGAASTRERCLDAVAALLVRVGPARMTLEAVAGEAKVGVASVYRIFGGRKGLLEAFSRERSPRSLLEGAMVERDAPLEATLETLVHAVMGQVFEHAPWFGLAFAQDEESRELVAVEREGRARLTDFMADQVERGELLGAPQVLAEALLSLAAGRALFMRAAGRQASVEDARVLAQLFLEGARGSRS